MRVVVVVCSCVYTRVSVVVMVWWLCECGDDVGGDVGVVMVMVW